MYRIFNRYIYKALEIGCWASANGSLAGQWDYLSGQNQQFKVQDAGGGRYQLTPMHISGKCLEIYNWSGANGGIADTWDHTGTGRNDQKWMIQATDNGY